MSAPDSLLVILGSQLFEAQHLPPPDRVVVFMAEDLGLCTEVRHHQQKIVLFLSAMRAYADELTDAGYRLHYVRLDANDRTPYEDKLDAALATTGCTSLVHFEIEDKPMEARLRDFAAGRSLDRSELASPMFLCPRSTFADYARGKKRLLMGDFYKQQRRKLGLLLDDDGGPTGGRWSFDADNRKKLPKTIEPPPLAWPAPNDHVNDVIAAVTEHFQDHPGNAAEFRWPTTRGQAFAWLEDFIDQRLSQFGPYEDAMTHRSASVFHSALTPCLNLGLITPAEVIERVMSRAGDVPLNSLEGFVRQVIGWREFVRGVYRQFSETQEERNFWQHDRDLTSAWYDGSTGIEPLDDTIRTAQRLGWTHHIPRLMVAANLMTLCEIRPRAAHRWFMEMYVDSAEWVMGPNVYGMGLFSDGGIFATKPYICGSNYLLKMSDYGKGPWCDVVDGLYWRFISRNREFFSGNPRLALMPRALDRIPVDRAGRIFTAAEEFIERCTVKN